MGQGSGKTAGSWALLMGSQRSGAAGHQGVGNPAGWGFAPWYREAQDKQGLPLCGGVLLVDFCGRFAIGLGCWCTCGLLFAGIWLSKHDVAGWGLCMAVGFAV